MQVLGLSVGNSIVANDHHHTMPKNRSLSTHLSTGSRSTPLVRKQKVTDAFDKLASAPARSSITTCSRQELNYPGKDSFRWDPKAAPFSPAQSTACDQLQAIVMSSLYCQALAQQMCAIAACIL